MFEGRRVCVVIPAYNEQRLIDRVLDTMPDFVDRMIVVDDASTDTTSQALCAAQSRMGERLRVVAVGGRRRIPAGDAVVADAADAVGHGGR